MGVRSAKKGAVLGVAASLTLAGCLGGGGGGGGGTSNQNQGQQRGPAASQAPATAANPEALRGQKVTILGAIAAEEAQAFERALQPFEQRTGIDVTYTGSNDFATLIKTRVQGNNAPDIAIFPQPGGLTDLVKTGKVVPLDTALNLQQLQGSLIPGVLDAAKGADGKTYGAPMRLTVKSLLWHPKPEFEQAGYQPPKTQQELLALTDKIKADGKTPWCLGIGAEKATGWVATDWIEEYVLRIGGPQFYDQWVKHEVPFNHPTVKQAAQEFEKIWAPEGNVRGGKQAIVNTRVDDAPDPMFESSPGCFLHRQGNFVTAPPFFPKNVTAALEQNVGLSVFPPMQAGQQPILGGGDLAALLDAQNPAAAETIKFMSSPEFGGPWAKEGGWLSPHKTFDASQYPSETTREIAKIASGATTFRFDASDLMPAQVGAGTFWTGMTDWLGGRRTLDEALDAIERSWPKR